MPRVTSRYDLRNRRTARIKADGSTDLFRYDPADQVTAAAYGQSNVASASAESPPNGAAADSNLKPETLNFEPSQTFSYDPAGNRLEVTDNGMTTKYQPNAANQYEQIVTGTEIVEPDFDPNGNLLHDDRNTYTWDADIHLLSVTTKPQAGEKGKVKSQKDQGNSTEPSAIPHSELDTPHSSQFRYDPLHRRIARLENNTQLTLFVMDGWNVIQEHAILTNHQSEIVNPKWSARHTWGEDLSGTLQGAGGIGGLLSSVHDVSTTQNQEQGITNLALFFHYDSNGDVILLTDSTAQDCARYSYDAFGQTKIATGITAYLNRYRFSTKPIEVGSGLAYYGYRYYDPVSGRWPSKDPLQEYGGLNIYVFANNDPIQVVDKLGLQAPPWTTVGNPAGTAALAELGNAISLRKGAQCAAKVVGAAASAGACTQLTQSAIDEWERLFSECSTPEQDVCWVEGYVENSDGPGGRLCIIKCKIKESYKAACGYDWEIGDNVPPDHYIPNPDEWYPGPQPLPDQNTD